MRYFSVSPVPGTQASLQAYLQEPAFDSVVHPVRPSVLIFPGGGYRYTSDREADPIAMAFLHAGYHAFVLRYTTRPDDSLPFLGDIPMGEGAAALRHIRANAAEWGVDPGKVSVCGFSAGGHAAGCTGVFWDTPRIPGNDRTGRPDAMLLCYPVISGRIFSHGESLFNLTGSAEPSAENDAYSIESHVTASSPPAFLWHTFEDKVVPVENSLRMAEALHSAGVPVELHAYTYGRHGLSLCTSETGTADAQAATWLPLALSWLDRMGLGPV